VVPLLKERSSLLEFVGRKGTSSRVSTMTEGRKKRRGISSGRGKVLAYLKKSYSRKRARPHSLRRERGKRNLLLRNLLFTFP